MFRFRSFSLYLLLFVSSFLHAAPPMNMATLASIDKATLHATQQGDILGLEPYLAPNFQVAIEVPTEHGRFQTLLFNREEFLLYAWQALNVAQAYQAETKSSEYKIAADGRTAIGTSTLEESVKWQDQALRYTTLRKTHYRPSQKQIQITLLEVKVLKWDQP